MKTDLVYFPIDNELTETQKENTINLIEALRSGNYKQTTTYLKTENGDGEICHCCLGVGSEILGVEFYKHNAINHYGDHSYCTIYFDNSDFEECRLPPYSWWKEHYGWDYNLDPQPLNCLNDHGRSFEEIANLIESIVIHKKDYRVIDF